MSPLSKLFEKNAIRAVLICFLGFLAGLSVYAGVRNALEYSQDFQWDAAKALSMRLDPYELSEDPDKALEHPELEQFYRMFTDRGLKQKMEANQFPSLLMLLGPMTLFAPQTAKALWLVINLLFTAGIIWLLRRTFFSKAQIFDFAVMMLLMIAGTPYRNQLGVGQHTLFAFFFFMLAVYVDEKRPSEKAWINTILTALCLFVSYFKYTLTAPLALLFLYRKRYKELAISVAAHVILTAASALWLSKSFIYMIKAPLSVASALAAEGGLDLGVLLGAKGGTVAAGLIFIALTVLVLKFPKDKEYLLFPLLVLWSLILTYHRTYDFFVLSAVSVMFCDRSAADHGEKIKNALVCWYALVLVLVYFGLRVFSESTLSRITVGAVYYAFTIAVSMVAVKMIRDWKKDNG